MFNWLSGKKSDSSVGGKMDPNENVTGIVLQAVHALEGGYHIGSSTLVHFVLQVEVGGNTTNQFVVVKASPRDFVHAPLLQVGDRVSVTFEGHGEREEILEISIDFAARAATTGRAAASQGCCG